MSNYKVINQPLSIIIGNCFGRYAKYIIQDRAIPDARDGLKPVQRRILYAMYDLGLTNDKPYKKSARTVGEVIGKYHPHGDSSIYESMVRMSQNWKNNLPLLDMHGNNGSIDGDSPAAMRYTETRLSLVANLMLENIKKNTVSFSFNFDDSEKEPTILPAMLPNLLINGSVGIAAGYATNIPPHNPTEVFNAIIYLIDNPNATLKEIIKIIPSPDFPTGGIIEDRDGVYESFKTGKGKFVLTSKLSVNLENKKFNQLIINEIPYDVSKSTIIKELNDIYYDEKIGGIIEIRDESDKNGINIVIEIKKDKNLDQIKNYLLKNTHLQINYTTNFVAIVNRKPILLDIISALKHYISHALDVQRKTIIFDLEKYQKRLEIVNGLVIAINNIDEVIELIRKSDSKEKAFIALVERFNFSDTQVEAILGLRLYKLSKTDISMLLEEADNLNQTINNLTTLLNSEELQKQWLKKTIYEYKSLYGYPRKTKISSTINKIEINEHEILDVKEHIIFVSRDGYIKKVNKKSVSTNSIDALGYRQFDFIFFSQYAYSNQYLILVTKLGKFINLPIYKLNTLKWKDIGEHLNTYTTIDSNDKVIFANVINADQPNFGLIVLTKNGISKKVNSEELINLKSTKSTHIIKLKSNDELVFVNLIDLKLNYFFTLINNNCTGYSFSSVDIPWLSKSASGIKTMKLKTNEYLVGGLISRTLQPYGLLVFNSGLKLINLDQFSILNRNSIGKSLFKLNKNETLINFIIVNKNSFITILNDDNKLINYSLSNLNPNNKNITKINNVNKIIDVAYNSIENGKIIEYINVDTILPKDEQSNDHDNENDDQLSLL